MMMMIAIMKSTLIMMPRLSGNCADLESANESDEQENGKPRAH